MWWESYCQLRSKVTLVQFMYDKVAAHIIAPQRKGWSQHVHISAMMWYIKACSDSACATGLQPEF